MDNSSQEADSAAPMAVSPSASVPASPSPKLASGDVLLAKPHSTSSAAVEEIMLGEPGHGLVKEDGTIDEAEILAEGSVPPEEQTGSNSKRSLVLVLLAIALALFLGSLDMTVVATALPTVARELNGIENLSWVATAYMLTSAAPQALWGRISDIFGRREILLFTIALFIASSAMCAAAPTMLVLIIGRALQGLGGGGINSVAFVVSSEIVSVRQRGMVQGLLQIVFAVSSIIGPVLGGLFAEGVGWRWIFWINLPIGAFSFIGIFFFLKVHPHRTDSIMHKLKTLDWFGAISITAATVLLLVGLTFGGQPQYGWTNPGTLVCIVLGVFLYPSFVLAEWKAGPEAMIPLALFRIRNFSLIAVSAFFLGISMFAPTYYIPLWFQIVREATATNAGLAFLPGFITSTVGGFFTGFMTTKTGIILPYYRVGFCILALGMGLDSLWTGEMAYAIQATLLGLTGFGFGLVIVTITQIVQASVPGQEIGPATTAIAFLQTMGGIFGLAVFNVILAHQINAVLPPQLDVIAAQYNISDSTMDYVVSAVLGGRPSLTLYPVKDELPPGSPQYDATVAAMQEATVIAFKYIFLAIGCLTVIPIVLSIFVQKPNLAGGTLAVLDTTEKKGEEDVDLEGMEAIKTIEVPVDSKVVKA